MLRLSIITEDNWVSLGINGVMSFGKVMNFKELSPIQPIDSNFIEKLQRMETYPFGFTEAYKVDFLKVFTNQLGKKCLLTSEWISKSNQARAQYHMDRVKLINEGKSIKEINAIVRKGENHV